MTLTSATLTESMELVALFFEALGALILIGGVVLSAWLAIRCLLRSRDAPRGVSGPPTVIRWCDPASPGSLGCRRPCQDRSRCADPGECGHSRTDRAHSHGSEFCARNRDRGRRALAASGDQRSQGHRPCRRAQRGHLMIATIARRYQGQARPVSEWDIIYRAPHRRRRSNHGSSRSSSPRCRFGRAAISDA